MENAAPLAQQCLPILWYPQNGSGRRAYRRILQILEITGQRESSIFRWTKRRTVITEQELILG